MADSKVTPITAAGSNSFKEAVCIDAGRIYDSCSDKDCVEGVEVFFTDCGQAVIEQANSVKCKSIEVLNVLLDVEPVLLFCGHDLFLLRQTGDLYLAFGTLRKCNWPCGA